MSMVCYKWCKVESAALAPWVRVLLKTSSSNVVEGEHMEGIQRFVSVTNMTVTYLTKKESIGVCVPTFFGPGIMKFSSLWYPT